MSAAKFLFMGEQEDPEFDTIRPPIVVHGVPIQHDHTQRTYPCGFIEKRENYGSGRHVHVSTRPDDAITCPGCLAEAKRHSEACAAVRR